MTTDLEKHDITIEQREFVRFFKDFPGLRKFIGTIMLYSIYV